MGTQGLPMQTVQNLCARIRLCYFNKVAFVLELIDKSLLISFIIAALYSKRYKTMYIIVSNKSIASLKEVSRVHKVKLNLEISKLLVHESHWPCSSCRLFKATVSTVRSTTSIVVSIGFIIFWTYQILLP